MPGSLFKPISPSITRQYGGTGLGLAISRRLVELMEGEMGLKSEPGKGSTFWFELSLKLQQQEEEENPVVSHEELLGKKVLIVDDNGTNREILHHQVIAWGMGNGSAEDGKQALEMLRAAAAAEQPYDLCLLDRQMPEMDGIELARRIVSDPAIPSPHLVMLSSAAPDGESALASEAGINRYLLKPVRQSVLYDCLLTVLGTSAAEDKPQPPLEPLAEGVALEAFVLLVEDNPVNQEVALSMLDLLGCKVEVTANGREALEAMSRETFDLVLMDCHMPEMDGFAAATEIRLREQLDGDIRHVPIIALTANVQEGVQERCRAAGMDDYLSKPFTREQLLERLRRWLDQPELSADSTIEARTASTFQPEQTPCTLNQEMLEGIRALQRPGRPDILSKAINLYIESSTELMQTIRHSIKQDEPEALRAAAHSLKSSSANLGAERFAAVCAELEEIGRQGITDAATKLLDHLESEYQSASLALQHEMRGIPAA